MSRTSARRLLLPVTPLYRLVLKVRESRLRSGREPICRLNFPVISIGNLSTGGAGKTPFAIALAQALTTRGFAVNILSRGYGRQSVAPARVRLDGTPEEFGDEPLLMADEAGVPVYVAQQRYEAGLLAESDAVLGDTRPRIHILDDAFQHRQLHRDVDILLLNRDDWQDCLLPAGNLREPLQAARRASVIAIPADDPQLESELRKWGWGGPVWRLHRQMEVPQVVGSVIAFCGIARPEQFFAGLERAGLHLAARIAFRDHHHFTARDLDRLQAAAFSTGAAGFITTRKDEIRLRSLSGGGGSSFLSADLRIEIEDQSTALDWVIERVHGSNPTRVST